MKLTEKIINSNWLKKRLREYLKVDCHSCLDLPDEGCMFCWNMPYKEAMEIVNPSISVPLPEKLNELQKQ